MQKLEIDIKKEICWDSKFELGIPRIDLEHKIFVGLLNSYRKALEMKCDKIDLIRIINEIEKYAEFHFVSEENFMLAISYPNHENHQFAHFELLERLNISKHDIDNPIDFLQFVYNWFASHTLNEDKHIAQFIKENKIEVNCYYNFEIIDKK